ncbi:MAG: peptidylprolyl isomerase [Bacteroidetes bacterium]|nr:MAG: peptidylprolyl isomerase [Bacteroidota bacterium]MBL1145348.1 peptidylprolyl isomerase [Bacteroidota bacterium]MCB0801879.1 peptidylprolyl isomerase [Flavobacteriales bacterium]NOG58146.1 peptidylprolyl isomerase [Bacteroidota bacterium]
MSIASKGNTVKVHYTGTLTDETVFDSSREREPIQFTVGAGQMIKGFDSAVEGMKVGESKKVKIASEEAYGPKNPEALFNVPKNQLPEGMEPQVGMQLEATQEDGRSQLLVVAEVHETEVTLDANHPLAGKDLVFDIELMEVV